MAARRAAEGATGFLHRALESESGRALLFVHTGGTPALFAYGAALTDAMCNL